MLTSYQLCCVAPLTMAAVLSFGAFGQQEPVVGPQIQLDPGVDSTRLALEYSVAAYEHLVVLLWRKRRFLNNQNNWTFGRAYTGDAGTTWTIDEQHGPGPQGSHEIDPATAVDSRTGSLWAGGYVGANAGIFSQRRAQGASEWDVNVGIVTGASHISWRAAGRRPDLSDSTRYYVGVSGTTIGNALVWSDSLGDDGTWQGPITPGFTFGFKLIRVGQLGELYVAGVDAVDSEARLARNFALDGASGPPTFDFDAHPISHIATLDPNAHQQVPGSFSVVTLPIIAVDPTQSIRVYRVYLRAGPPDGNGNRDVDIYLRKTDDASAQFIDWGSEIQLPIPGDQIFPWIECDPSGRLHLICMDSRNNPNQPDNDPDNGLFDVYYAYSTDQGQSWSHHRLTPNSFDVLGETFFHDYLGLAVAGNRVCPAYADIAGPEGNKRPEAFTNCIVFGEDSPRADFTVLEEVLLSGGLAELAASDDQRLIVRDNPSLIGTTLHTDLIVGFDSAVAAPKDIDLRIECNASRPSTTGRVSIKDWVTGTWYAVGVYNASMGTDSEVWFCGIYADNPGIPAPDFDFVRDSDGRVELRLEHEANTAGTQFPLDSRYDWVQMIVVPQ